MLKILHRVNTLEQLNSIDKTYGVEIDIRSYKEELVVVHDPFQVGLKLIEWLQNYHHAFVIFNIKEEGLENSLIEILREYNIKDYFLLDVSFPATIDLIRNKESRIAIRVSDYESVETAFNLSGKASWIWVDLFKDVFPLSYQEVKKLRALGYSLCLVSPELWGRSKESINTIRQDMLSHDISVEAVCTKFPNEW
tara:strand:+ start:2095 stop:2679 length:585 start_codon:yes stop_codon:yes gene_type:complete